MSDSASPRSIVCGVDDSGFSDHAVVVAYGLARDRDLTVRLVHASGFVGLLERLTGDDLDEARSKTVARLTERLVAAGFEAPRVAPQLETVDGPAARALVQAAETHDAALIVLGRHQGLSAVGDTVRAVLSHAPCPVLVQSAEPRPITRILAAVDLSSESQRVMATARDEALARGLETSVSVLHCFVRPDLGYIFGYALPMPESVVEDLKRIAPKLGISGYQPLIRFYVGQGMRVDLARLESSPVQALVDSLKRRGVSEETIDEAMADMAGAIVGETVP